MDILDLYSNNSRQPVQINSGRLMIRQIESAGSNSSIFAIGILHLPSNFIPKENACYLISYEDESVFGFADRVDEGNPHFINDTKEKMPIDIVYAMQGKTWPVPLYKNMMPVRFIKAFPESNEWTFYGVSKSNIFNDVQLDNAGHGWLDIERGKVKRIDSPVDEVGKQPTQILREPVWPNKAGGLYALSAIESEWRPVYHELSLIYASFGGGEITRDQMNDQIKSNPLFDNIRQRNIDESYCRYLFELNKANGIQEDGPKSESEFLRHHQLCREIVRSERKSSKIRM